MENKKLLVFISIIGLFLTSYSYPSLFQQRVSANTSLPLLIKPNTRYHIKNNITTPANSSNNIKKKPKNKISNIHNKNKYIDIKRKKQNNINIHNNHNVKDKHFRINKNSTMKNRKKSHIQNGNKDGHHSSRSNNKNKSRRIHKKVRKYSQYNIFQNTSLKKFHVVYNSQRDNARLPYFHYQIPVNPYLGRYPQSLAVLSSGNYAYVGYDSYVPGYMRVVRYNLKNGYTKVGPWFRGGHGQNLAYNPDSGFLWCFYRNMYSNKVVNGDDDAGQTNNGTFYEISPNTLKPIYSRHFTLGNHLKEFLGNDLCFTPNGTAYNVDRIWNFNRTNKKYRKKMLVAYQGYINRQGSKWYRIQAIRHEPGDIIEAIGYNPRNKKIYIEGNSDNRIISVPANKLSDNRARYNDIKLAGMRTWQEPEGIAFDKKGYCYILLSEPDEILKSYSPFVGF